MTHEVERKRALSAVLSQTRQQELKEAEVLLLYHVAYICACVSNSDLFLTILDPR